MTLPALIVTDGDRASIRAIADALKACEAGRISKEEYFERVAKIVEEDDARRARESAT